MVIRYVFHAIDHAYPRRRPRPGGLRRSLIFERDAAHYTHGHIRTRWDE
jgi:hypothetical protein